MNDHSRWFDGLATSVTPTSTTANEPCTNFVRRTGAKSTAPKPTMAMVAVRMR